MAALLDLNEGKLGLERREEESLPLSSSKHNILRVSRVFSPSPPPPTSWLVFLSVFVWHLKWLRRLPMWGGWMQRTEGFTTSDSEQRSLLLLTVARPSASTASQPGGEVGWFTSVLGQRGITISP